MNKEEIKITPNGIKQAIDNLLEENEQLQKEKKELKERIEKYQKYDGFIEIIENFYSDLINGTSETTPLGLLGNLKKDDSND